MLVVHGPVAIFRGTFSETKALLIATENSCVDPDRCLKDPSGKVVQVCAAHRALLNQRFLDGILCERRRQAEILAEEFR
jgi:hypothetical protein